MKTYRRTSHHPFLILQSFNLLTAGFCDKISSFIIDTFLGSNTLFICLSCCAYARWNPSCNPPRPSGWLAHPLAYRNSSHQSWNMHVSRCHKRSARFLGWSATCHIYLPSTHSPRHLSVSAPLFKHSFHFCGKLLEICLHSRLHRHHAVVHYLHGSVEECHRVRIMFGLHVR